MAYPPRERIRARPTDYYGNRFKVRGLLPRLVSWLMVVLMATTATLVILRACSYG
jgi:hypothetical protein